ncbi:DUF1360 domain-containing protein [Streptomyces sp. A0642]|uniref:DUF1360 domain-containing protein n=1 Tax=Streptomyces sp. A0642 TaxID=2563100 RepID=UPI0010A20117|nr:DUF1360 domain-containing protein [Streptomyces sp. A0642]THA77350.1 DUF1360 domain-containing protein [Streptomyces sp. A0642]
MAAEEPTGRNTGQDYDERGAVPLLGYAAIAGTYTAACGALVVLARRRGVVLPERVPPWDVALLGVATYKTARLLTKDKITSFLRAPFSRRSQDTTAGEVADEPRGRGLRLAMGDLVTCPFCAASWTATGLLGTYVLAPRAARLIGAGFGAMAVADWMQYAWAWTQRNAEG